VLADAGMTEPPDEDRGMAPRTLIAAPWAPPRRDELPACVAAVESLAERFDIEAAWFHKVETGIDGVAWAELVAEAADVAPEPDDDDDGGEPDPVDEPAADPAADEPIAPSVLYTAPEITAAGIDTSGEREDDDDDDDDLDADFAELDAQSQQQPDVESHWRHGPPTSASRSSSPGSSRPARSR